jgi:hypothetical protein
VWVLQGAYWALLHLPSPLQHSQAPVLLLAGSVQPDLLVLEQMRSPGAAYPAAAAAAASAKPE